MENLLRQKFTWVSARVVVLDQYDDAASLLGNADIHRPRLSVLSNRFKELSVREEFLSGNSFAHKYDMRNMLEKMAYANCCSLLSYAKSEKNNELFNQFSYTKTNFNTCNDEELRRISRTVYNSAQTYIKPLAKFGITTETQADFFTCITEFETAIPEAFANKSARKQVREEMKEIIKEFEEIFTIFDLSIVKLQFSHPEFYSAYMNVKKEKIREGRSMVAGIWVMDDVSGKPVRNAKIIFEMVNGTTTNGGNEKDVIIEKISGKMGRSWLKHAPVARYKYRIHHSEYEDKNGEVYIEEDILNKIVIRLKPRIN